MYVGIVPIWLDRPADQNRQPAPPGLSHAGRRPCTLLLWLAPHSPPGAPMPTVTELHVNGDKRPVAADPDRTLPSVVDIDPERYEFFETPTWSVNRRDVFRIAGAGLVVALVLGDGVPAQQPQRRGGRGGGSRPAEIGAWLHIGEDGAVTVYTGK